MLLWLHAGIAVLSRFIMAIIENMAQTDPLLEWVEKEGEATRQAVQEVKSVLLSIQKSIAIQTLQWAIGNTAIEEFRYHKQEPRGGETCDVKYSAYLVKSILLAFMRENGYPIQGWVWHSGMTLEEGREKFHQSLSRQIHALTGQEPRIVLEGDRWLVYQN